MEILCLWEVYRKMPQKSNKGVTGMKAESKKRFARSIRRYLDSLERDAKAYCYKGDVEYQELKQHLQKLADKYAVEGDGYNGRG